MKRLRADRFHFQKAAAKRVRGGRLDWEAEIEKMLAESVPFVIQGGMETRIEWDENDPEQGFALGKVVVVNRPPQPAVLPRQDMQMQRLGVQDQGKTAIIPIHVENSEIQTLSVFLDDKGMAHPLTEKRWTEIMGATGMMGEVDPNAPDPQALSSADLPRGAAGFDRLSNVKVAAERDFELLEHGLRALHPLDHARIVKLASDPSVLAGAAEARLFPLLRLIVETRSVSTRDYDQALIGSLPVNLVYIEEMQPSPTSPQPKKWRATLVSDRYFAPKYVEGSYRAVSDALRELVPNVGALLEQGGSHLIHLNRTRTCNPLVLEDIAFTPDVVRGGGHWLVMTKKGDVMRADVAPNVFGFDGKPTGQMLFIGDGHFGMTNEAVGRKVSDSLEMAKDQIPVGTPIRSKSWVSLVLPGNKYTTPISVVSSSVVGGCPVFAGETLDGKMVAIRFVPGLQALVRASTSLPAQFSLAEGYARFYAPMDTMIQKLGCLVSIEDDKTTVIQRLSSYVRTGSKVNGRNVMRFTLGDEAEHEQVVVRHFGDDQWGLAGLPVGSVMGQNSADALAAAQVKFIFAVLGCTEAQTAKIMSDAESRGRITVSGLRGVRKVVEASGKVAVPYLQKMGALAMRLRADVPEKHRDALFKAATCFDVVAIGENVKAFMADGENRKKLAWLGSILPRFHDAGGEHGIEKLAEVFAHPESIDVMLGLNVLNERTVSHFLRNLPRMRRVEDHLAELVMLTRQGLAGVKADDAEEAMKSLNRVVERLEFLSQQVQDSQARQQYE